LEWDRAIVWRDTMTLFPSPWLFANPILMMLMLLNNFHLMLGMEKILSSCNQLGVFSFLRPTHKNDELLGCELFSLIFQRSQFLCGYR
jgi:hypothetical protein